MTCCRDGTRRSGSEPTETGTYSLFCTQFCGTDHAAMIGRVIVMSGPDYAALAGAQQNVGRPGRRRAGAVSGERMQRLPPHRQGTGGGSTVRAPPLAGLFGSPVPLSDGTVVVADEQYIRDFILQPGSRSSRAMRRSCRALPGGSARRICCASSPISNRWRRARSDERASVQGRKSRRATCTDKSSVRSLAADDRPQADRASCTLLSITVFFFVGGLAATLMRLEPDHARRAIWSAPETYNKLFTIHGVVMVWFFLIPSIPARLGNFLLPLMLGARDLAFPRSTC